jgi:hypothetical protein
MRIYNTLNYLILQGKSRDKAIKSARFADKNEERGNENEIHSNDNNKNNDE